MITSPESAPSPRRRSEKSRRATLSAALDLCAQDGYGKVTIEAIAGRAGVSKKTIYRWWPTKGAVLLDAVTDLVANNSPLPDTGDIGADLRTHIGSLVRLFESSMLGPAYRGILSQVLYDEELATAVNDQLVIPRVALVYERMRGAQAVGQLPPDADLPLAVEMMYGPLYYRHSLGRPMPGPELVEMMVAHVVRALWATAEQG
ncbi:TetR/AcrR family transcriptional regulator [Streptomyces sp. NPDC048111]|uniref:TetR/AcrR family transcriptional regulator n=1 Tax=Streptomyces sp. NPDC048111 TaxID=3365500 RepID=UPI00371C0601